VTVDTRGLTRARIAILVDRFHLTPRDIGQLTDRMIHQVYFHERDKDGAIKVPIVVPEPAMSEDEKAAQLEVLRILLSPEDFQRMKQEVAAKNGKVNRDEP
jgi:hypothetical protein